MGFIKKALGLINPYFSVAIAYWRVILLASSAVIAFWLGYRLHTLQDAENELSIQKKAISDYQRSQEFNNTVSASYELGRQKAMSDTKTTHQALKVARAKTPSVDCPLSSDELQATNQ